MTNKEIATIANQMFNTHLEHTSKASTNGSHAASRRLMDELVVKTHVLRSLGYMTNDNGKVVKFKPDPMAKLALKASTGDVKAAKKILEIMSGQG